MLRYNRSLQQIRLSKKLKLSKCCSSHKAPSKYCFLKNENNPPFNVSGHFTKYLQLYSPKALLKPTIFAYLLFVFFIIVALFKNPSFSHIPTVTFSSLYYLSCSLILFVFFIVVLFLPSISHTQRTFQPKSTIFNFFFFFSI